MRATRPSDTLTSSVPYVAAASHCGGASAVDVAASSWCDARCRSARRGRWTALLLCMPAAGDDDVSCAFR